MKKISAQAAARVAVPKAGFIQAEVIQDNSVRLMSEIQEQMQDMFQPHYHEFYKVTTERGFTKITMPKKGKS